MLAMVHWLGQRALKRSGGNNRQREGSMEGARRWLLAPAARRPLASVEAAGWFASSGGRASPAIRLHTLLPGNPTSHCGSGLDGRQVAGRTVSRVGRDLAIERHAVSSRLRHFGDA
jgi:hypothetical protein